MHCFECSRNEIETPAVAVCLSCGRALCDKHCVEVTSPVRVREEGGMGIRVVSTGLVRSRILCEKCASIERVVAGESDR